ncbi:ras-related and estrogen-regulated growth inhibitor [Exaiptasia diaphana]|uniref:small monomeric GTPase n=1 Tax=Exaiptasia diaphana TaxID=2652724 RepID=A0A913XD25_EXADI|nr:ras-related and estrogen-regulated growth inhibitor [Exaiptasia diaphana]KXJ26412.1 Ras-related and estrogen-regulated growth inhibitor [Exaiptasia diaphana]
MCQPSSPAASEGRFLVIGSKGVGKSAVTVRYLTKRFIGEYQSVMELTYIQKLKLDEDVNGLTFEIRDTLERGDISLYESSIRWADAFLVVYSITDKNSFNNAIQLVEAVYDGKGTDEVHVALIGNKTDLDHFRKVTKEEGKSAAEQLGCMFYEVSAAENYENVQVALNSLFRKVTIHKKLMFRAKEKRKNSTSSEKKKYGFGNGLFKRKASTERKNTLPKI